MIYAAFQDQIHITHARLGEARSALRYLLVFWLLLIPVATVAAAAVQPAAVQPDAGRDAMAMDTARIVGAILEYTRWPSDRPIVRLCLAGVPLHAGRLGDIRPSSGARIELSNLPTGSDGARARCDALYIGQLAIVPARRLIAGLRGRPVTTIAEDDPDCRSGAMFCLRSTPRGLSFQLNIDAVSRSGVRIDPRVLRISKGAI